MLCFAEVNSDKSLFIIAQTLDEHGGRLNSPTSPCWTLPRAPARLPAPSRLPESSPFNSRMGSANLCCYSPHQWLINAGSESKWQCMDFSRASPRRERGESLGAVRRNLISSPIQMERGWKTGPGGTCSDVSRRARGVAGRQML